MGGGEKEDMISKIENPSKREKEISPRPTLQPIPSHLTTLL
jgi:hypothetical protein